MISGLQKMTLLDFPGKVACTVFLQGCNWRCPFCHNSELIAGKPVDFMEEEAFLRFLQSRKGLLDGVCISGGEPTLYPGLPDLLAQIKALGYAVKLDTNGSRPDVIQHLVQEGLIDYIAMDVKNSPARYAVTAGTENLHLGDIERSIQYLVSSPIPYELRTTVVSPLHDEESILEMGKWLSEISGSKKPEKLFLQGFVDRDTVAFSGLSAPDEAAMERYVSLLAPYVEQVSVRSK